MRVCIELMDSTLREVSDGGALQPVRSRLAPPGVAGALGIMPGFIHEPRALGIKAVTVFDGNFAKGRPSHQGAMLLFDAETGDLRGIFDAGAITAVRTAAASAVATRALSRADAQSLAILGYGEQAMRHAEAMLLVRPIDHVAVWGRNPARAAACAAQVAVQHSIQALPQSSAAAAVQEADIICTTTATRVPILRGESVPAGCHLNLVGSSFPDAREVDSELVARSSFFVDSRPMVEALGGEIRQALEEQSVSPRHILGEIGEVLAQRIPGRRFPGEITVFKSVGLIAEDLTVAAHLLESAGSARGRDVATWIDF